MEEESKESKPVTQLQMLEAQRYVRSYVAFNGGDPYGIDWDHKPKFLPKDVSAAWDTIDAYWTRLAKEGIIE